MWGNVWGEFFHNIYHNIYQIMYNYTSIKPKEKWLKLIACNYSTLMRLIFGCIISCIASLTTHPTKYPHQNSSYYTLNYAPSKSIHWTNPHWSPAGDKADKKVISYKRDLNPIGAGVLLRGETPKACMHRGKAIWVTMKKTATCEPRGEV